jgi:hypothetical protein
MAARSRLLSVGILLVAGLTSLPLQLAIAQSAASSQPATSLMASGDSSVRLLANIAVILTCTLIIVGGLFVFFRRGYASQETWGPISVQTLGTIFFFPTLILLAVYLELPKDAITTILGAFLGYLFGRSSSGGGSTQASDPSVVSEGGPRLRPASGADLRAPEDEPAHTPARAAPDEGPMRAAA